MHVTLEANRILGMIYRNMEFKTNEVIIPLCCSLVRPRLEYCVQAWRPCFVKGIARLEKVEKRAVNMIQGLSGSLHTESLVEVGLESLESTCTCRRTESANYGRDTHIHVHVYTCTCTCITFFPSRTKLIPLSWSTMVTWWIYAAIVVDWKANCLGQRLGEIRFLSE